MQVNANAPPFIPSYESKEFVPGGGGGGISSQAGSGSQVSLAATLSAPSFFPRSTSSSPHEENDILKISPTVNVNATPFVPTWAGGAAAAVGGSGTNAAAAPFVPSSSSDPASASAANTTTEEALLSGEVLLDPEPPHIQTPPLLQPTDSSQELDRRITLPDGDDLLDGWTTEDGPAAFPLTPLDPTRGALPPAEHHEEDEDAHVNLLAQDFRTKAGLPGSLMRPKSTVEMAGGAMYFYEAGAHQVNSYQPFLGPRTTTTTSASMGGPQKAAAGITAQQKVRGETHVSDRFVFEKLYHELQLRSYLKSSQDDVVNTEGMPELPEMVHNFHTMVYLEESEGEQEVFPACALRVGSLVMKGIQREDGQVYSLRRLDHRALPPTGPLLTRAKARLLRWGRLPPHPALLLPHSVFVSRQLYDTPAIFFTFPYLPTAITLERAHLSRSSPTLWGAVTEEALWSYAVQLVGAVRHVHQAGLACRPGALAPSKILVTALPTSPESAPRHGPPSKGGARLFLGSLGIADILVPESELQMDNNPTLRQQLQTLDIQAVGHTLLRLACGPAAQAPSLDLASMHFSPHLVQLLAAMLDAGQPGGLQEVRQLSGLLAEHMWGEMEASWLHAGVLEACLEREMENGRLFRLMVKIGMITERAELAHDPAWAETGDRYLIKLFRDWVFHRHTDSGAPSVDWGLVIESLNKLDAGSPEKILLMSRDEMSMLVVSYRQIKHCLENAYNELMAKAAASLTEKDIRERVGNLQHRNPYS